MANTKDKKQCGECQLIINDLEPIGCGFCGNFFHISQQCCGFNIRLNRELFTQGKVIFICTPCRNELNGRSIRRFIDDNSISDGNSVPITALDKLTQQLDSLSKKFDDMAQKQYPPITAPSFPPLKGTPRTYPSPNIKRRRGNDGHSLVGSTMTGTKSVDLSDLSVSFIVPPPATPKFWLYLAGLQPQISDDDVNKIISRCLNPSTPVEMKRLLPKGVDGSTRKYVSFKIGLDPMYKDAALNPMTWPTGLLFREFVDQPKNYNRQPLTPAPTVQRFQPMEATTPTVFGPGRSTTAPPHLM
ncbi:uncharacterized protein LOC129753381 [Uranotaenia lowii]|uniref:uncharacterized protein LOC129753381 n=1 Tax=Uranotaenia lowii TaxID=190385 RepID=UPI002478C1DB|nr:uncharacterized protein LOC129753381 [Uranotaenia lowii]